MTRRNIKKAILVLFVLATFAEIVFGILDFFEIESGDNFNYYSGGYLVVVILLLLNNNKKKKYFYKMYMENTMSNDEIFELTGKEVQIRTLDEYISGKVKSTDGDFIIVEKQKKKGIEKTFINKNSIQTIKIK